MEFKYLQVLNDETARTLSEGIFNLMKPAPFSETFIDSEGVEQTRLVVPSFTTKYFCHWRTKEDLTFLELDLDAVIYISSAPDPSLMLEGLSLLIQSGVMPEQRIDFIQNAVATHMGQNTVLSNFIWPEAMALLKTKAELEALGFEF